MATKRVSIVPSQSSEDILGEKISSSLQSFFKQNSLTVATARSYLFEGDFLLKHFDEIVHDIMLDPIISKAVTEPSFFKDFDFFIDISYKAGVTDNVTRSLKRAIETHWNTTVSNTLQTSVFYFIKGIKNGAELKSYVEKYMSNPLIEDVVVMSYDQWSKQGFDDTIKVPSKTDFQLLEYIDINKKSHSELEQFSKERLLFLNAEEMGAIKGYYSQPEVIKERQEKGLKPMPTDVEMEMLAQTWSEHCKHKIFAATIEYEENGKKETISSLYKTYIKDATKELMKKRDDLLSVFSDNAGIFRFDEKTAVCLKVETHNSPSALDPYGGAMTGIVGVNRDILGTGMGAKPIFNTDVFCFGHPDYNGELYPNMHHPKTIFKGVHRGVKEGGNESGIPTVNGAMVFDDGFMGKPLVFCGTAGIMPLEINGKPSYQKYLKTGDKIVIAGGHVGKDGIHGATFSSGVLTEDSPTSAVQIGDPMTQKRVMNFLLEARDLELFSSITDNGAGGISSSVGEMATGTNGATILLDKVLLKYPGLNPWQILISESQERMTFAVRPEKMNAFMDLAKRRGVDAYEIGEFNDSGYMDILYGKDRVGYLSMEFLHDGLPTMQLKAKWEQPHFKEPDVSVFAKSSPKETLLSLLQQPNIASKERWVREYDHEVKGQSVMKPFEGVENDGPSDGGVIRPLKSKKSLAIACGINPFYSQIDTYHMTAACIDEAIRNLLCVGVNPNKMYCLDNFCWPDPIEGSNNPDALYKLAQLVRSNKALKDYTLSYNIPLISGKDSMKNDYKYKDKKISILPTLLVTAIGIVEDTQHVLTSFLKKEGNLLYLLGDTHKELGGSELYRMFKHVGNDVPKVDAQKNMKLYQIFYTASTSQLMESVHDLSEGGLAVAIAEMCIGGRKGAEISLKNDGLTEMEMLYSESQGRLLVEISPSKKDAFEKLFASQSYKQVGVVKGENLSIGFNGTNYLTADVETLSKKWKEVLNF